MQLPSPPRPVSWWSECVMVWMPAHSTCCSCYSCAPPKLLVSCFSIVLSPAPEPYLQAVNHPEIIDIEDNPGYNPTILHFPSASLSCLLLYPITSKTSDHPLILVTPRNRFLDSLNIYKFGFSAGILEHSTVWGLGIE